MRKILFILLLSFFHIAVFAADGAEGQQAEQAYAGGDYATAAGIYEKMREEGMESAALYYNLGNCYYKLGENTQAILNYERALLLDPGDAMARYNLGMAQQAIVDNIDVLPELFLVRWY